MGSRLSLGLGIETISATAGLVSESDFPCLQYAQKDYLSILDMDLFSEYIYDF